MYQGHSGPVDVLDAAFEHLCLDVFPPAGIRLMVYLTFNGDESENVQPGKPHIYTVAGWIAEVADWATQREPWESAMVKWGLTRRGFHMTDFIGGYQEYRGEDWQNQTRKKARYAHLCKLIARNRLHGFASSVNTEDYDQVLTPELEKHGLKGRYHGFNVVRVMEDVEEWVDAQGYKEPVSIHYVFARKDGVVAEIDWLFDRVGNDPELRDRFRIMPEPWSPGDMRRDVRLQPADILACLSNRRAVRFAERPENPARIAEPFNANALFEVPERPADEQSDGWLETLVDHVGENKGITAQLYNNRKTLMRWMERMATAEGVISPDRKGSEWEGLRE